MGYWKWWYERNKMILFLIFCSIIVLLIVIFLFWLDTYNEFFALIFAIVMVIILGVFLIGNTIYTSYKKYKEETQKPCNKE